MCTNLKPLSHCALDDGRNYTVAINKGKQVNKFTFHHDVKKYALAFSRQKNKHFALFYEDAYWFCVYLFALLHNNKKVWIAGNNKTTTAGQLTKLGCLLVGEWQGLQLVAEPEPSHDFKLQSLDMAKSEIMMFTSGTSGKAKIISKSLNQFQSEINFLENQWGELLGQAQVLATVSHQHIYGLIFQLLWPLSSGRCFHSQIFLSPEPLLKTTDDINAYWVASPAQLKRLDENTPWNELASLKAIFSSGGFLPIEAASQILSRCGIKVLEVYGSTETGGIAWRQSVNDSLWTPFTGINLRMENNEGCYLSSPYLKDDAAVLLDDKIKQQSNGQFALLGRLDRIVKVEEKRLSLDQLEQALVKSDWISQAYTLLLSDSRDKIATALKLTDKGEDFFHTEGRALLIKSLRQQLMDQFETVVLPRKWVFIQTMPLTAQGKIDQDLLIQLFSLNSELFPQVHSFDYHRDRVELQIRIPPGLLYFPGHFPVQPILPGVTQLTWVETFGKLFFNIDLPFLRMEVIKFKKIIQPGDLVQMKLNWKAETGKLYFEMYSKSDSHSSGRMLYGVDR